MIDTAQLALPLPGLPLQVAPAKRARRRSGASAGAVAPRGDLDAGQLRAERHAYLGLVSRWDLSGREALVLAGEPLDAEAEGRERRRALLGVNRLLRLVHPEVERSRLYLRRPQPALGDAAPLQVMLAQGCPGIVEVRRLLAVEAGF